MHRGGGGPCSPGVRPTPVHGQLGGGRVVRVRRSRRSFGISWHCTFWKLPSGWDSRVNWKSSSYGGHQLIWGRFEVHVLRRRGRRRVVVSVAAAVDVVMRVMAIVVVLAYLEFTFFELMMAVQSYKFEFVWSVVFIQVPGTRKVSEARNAEGSENKANKLQNVNKKCKLDYRF